MESIKTKSKSQTKTSNNTNDLNNNSISPAQDGIESGGGGGSGVFVVTPASVALTVNKSINTIDSIPNLSISPITPSEPASASDQE